MMDRRKLGDCPVCDGYGYVVITPANLGPNPQPEEAEPCFDCDVAVQKGWLPSSGVSVQMSEAVKPMEFRLNEFDHVVVRCPHMSIFQVLDNRWTIVSKEPLTVTPSIHHTDCGCHGFITNGEWVAV